MTTLWKSDITRVGDEAGEMIDAGVLILFGEPVPEALADVSVVHKGASELARPLNAGDRFQLGGQYFSVKEVGDRACGNLTELGHVVLYINQPGQELLPGAIKVTGPALQSPAVGSAVSFVEG